MTQTQMPNAKSTTTAEAPSPVSAGLEGVVVAQTSLCRIDGQAGTLHICGYPVEQLAQVMCWEDVVVLLRDGVLGAVSQTDILRAELEALRATPEAAHRMQAVYASATSLDTFEALRMGLSALPSTGDDRHDAALVWAYAPLFVGAAARASQRLPLVMPRSGLSTAAQLLWLVRGSLAAPLEVAALDQYLTTVAEHGLNASAFCARVVASTGADLLSAVIAGVCALKGPLHGGAPGPALELVFEVERADRAAEVIGAKLRSGQRLMGFGHRVYRTRDPRAVVLAKACSTLMVSPQARDLLQLAAEVERTALAALARHKPERPLQTNVEFYTALLLHALGIPSDVFSALFAVGRTAGYCAHVREQRAANRLIRPSARYIGPIHEAVPTLQRT